MLTTEPIIEVDPLADFTLRLVGVRSPSGQEGDVAELVAQEMEHLGFTVAVDDLGTVTGTLSSGPGPCVLIDSHMDTVGVTDPGVWQHDPWGQRIGDRLYGRGTMDMKGPLAASIYGIASLRDRLQRGTIVVSASVAEELVEGPATVEVAKRVRPDYVIICEATSLNLARGQRGRAEIKLETMGRPTHSSRPDLGVNAAQAMVDVIAELRSLAPPTHPVLGSGILVLTDIISRPYPALSVVPDYCMATYDRRTLPGETEETVLEPIREAVHRALADTEARGEVQIAEDDFETYPGREVRAPNFAPAWYFDDDFPIVQRSLHALHRTGIDSQLTHYAFCTNGSGTAGRLGIPTVGFGPGEEALAHRVDESIAVEELVTAARGYAAIAEQLIGEEA
jgi:putative selenium metabolism hydrolase